MSFIDDGERGYVLDPRLPCVGDGFDINKERFEDLAVMFAYKVFAIFLFNRGLVVLVTGDVGARVSAKNSPRLDVV